MAGGRRVGDLKGGLFHRREKLRAAALVLILLLGTALLWHDLTAREVLGKDENATLIKLDQPGLLRVLKASGVKANGLPGSMQPLYFLAQYFTWPLVRHSAFVLRFLPSVFGILGIALTCRLGRLLWSAEAGLAGALWVAVLPLHVEYGQVIRPYTLLSLLSLASAVLLVRALDNNRPLDWAGFVLTAALGVYNHFNALLVLAAEGLFAAVVWVVMWVMLLKGRHRGSNLSQARRLAGPALAFLAVGLLCLPALLRLFSLRLGMEGGEPAVQLTVSFFYRFLYKIGLTSPWLRGLLLGVMGLGLTVTLRRRRWQVALLALLWLAVPFVILSVVRSGRPFDERYVIFGPPVALLLAGEGLVAISRFLGALGGPLLRRGGGIAIGVALAAGLALWFVPPLRAYYAANRASNRMDRTLSVMERHLSPGDLVVVSPRFFVRPLAVDGAEVLFLDEHLSPADLDALAARYPRMWVLYTSYIVPVELQEPLDRWIQSRAEEFVRVRLKATTTLAYRNRTLTDVESVLLDRGVLLEEMAGVSADEKEAWVRWNALADIYQALSELYAGRGEVALAAEYQRKAEEARTAGSTP